MPQPRKTKPGPPRDRKLRAHLENFLIETRHRQMNRRELQQIAEAFLGKKTSRQSVKNWCDFWTEEGFLVAGRARDDLGEQLFLLLLDVPVNSTIQARVARVLEGRTRGAPETIAGVFNVLVRVPGRSIAAVERIATACIAQGALDARALVTTATPK